MSDGEHRPDGSGKLSWYEEFYARVDAMDIDAMEELCTPDTVLRFANGPEARGRAAMREALGHAWAPLQGLRHEIVEVTESGDTAVVEAVVHYSLRDGGTVSVPSATAVQRRDGLVAAQRVYMDLAPLREALQAPSEEAGP